MSNYAELKKNNIASPIDNFFIYFFYNVVNTSSNVHSTETHKPNRMKIGDKNENHNSVVFYP